MIDRWKTALPWDELLLLARTIAGEARGESFEGKKAVAHVVVNRVKKGGWWGNTIPTVCLKPWQFSCWNEDDPNLRKIADLDLRSPVLRECMAAALLAMNEDDPTGGATHYHRCDPHYPFPPPRWAQGKMPVCQIGRHCFYRDID